MSVFSVSTQSTSPFAIIDVQGEIDLHTCPNLHQALTAQLDTSKASFILNLENVSYIDSTGLGVIAHAARKLDPENGRIHIVSTNPQLLKVLELSGLTQKNLSIHANLNLAQEALQ